MSVSSAFFRYCRVLLPFACALALPSTLAAQTAASVPSRQSHYQSGLAAWQSGDLKSARASFEAVVKLNPRDSDAQNALAQVLLQQGEVAAAIPHFRTVTRLKPSLAIGHVYLGQALSLSGDRENAITELRTGVRLAPQQPEAHEALARVLSAHGDDQEAQSEMRRAVDLAPKRPELHDALGSLLAQQKETDSRHQAEIDAQRRTIEALRNLVCQKNTRAAVCRQEK